MSITHLLNKTGIVYRPTVTMSDTGGFDRTEAVLIAALRCRLEALSGSEREMRGATGVLVTHRLYCDVPTAAITEKDEIVIDSVRYRVKFVDNVQELGHHEEILVEELRDGDGC
jgi:hypothetical protein